MILISETKCMLGIAAAGIGLAGEIFFYYRKGVLGRAVPLFK